MEKTMWSTFLVATFVLLLNLSHGTSKQFRSILNETQKQDALDIFKIVYNVFNNDTYIMNIMNSNLWTWSGMIYGDVELGQTTCTRIESGVEKCPLQTRFQPTKDSQGVTRYVISNQVQNTCSKFLSQLTNCPFNEQVDQQKRVFCNFVITKFSIQVYKIVVKVKCLKV